MTKKTKDKKKILFVLESFYPNVGGVEDLFKQLCDEVSRVYEITVFTAKPQLAKPQTTCLPAGTANYKVQTTPFKSRYLFTFLGFFYLLRHIRNFDIVHTTSYNAAFPAYLAAKLFRKKTIITFHEYWGDLWFKLPYLNFIQRYLYYFFEKLIVNLSFDKFVAVSDATKNSLIKAGIKEDKITRIYNGLDYDKFQNSDSKFQTKGTKLQNTNYKFLFFGRAGVSKGLDLLVQAIKLTKDLDYKLTIHSTDSRQFGVLEQIEKHIKNNNLENKISINKSRIEKPELYKLIQNSDCVIIPSYTEGFGFSAAETCALGVPVIHSGKGSLNEVVSGKYLVFEDMDPKDLAEKMRLAMEGEFEFKELRKFEINECVDSYKYIYKSLS